jgi:hypothetical protein
MKMEMLHKGKRDQNPFCASMRYIVEAYFEQHSSANIVMEKRFSLCIKIIPGISNS